MIQREEECLEKIVNFLNFSLAKCKKAKRDGITKVNLQFNKSMNHFICIES